jgi:hypothetical protein
VKIKIEKDVPLPRGSRATKYPFTHMDVGDSVFFPDEKVSGKAHKAAISCAERNNMKFVARREEDGVRIWRQA